MLSHYYPDDKERGNVLAIAFGGFGLGVLIAPIFGAFFYEYYGKPVPFLIIAAFALIDGCKCEIWKDYTLTGRKNSWLLKMNILFLYHLLTGLRLFISDPKPDEKSRKPEGPSLLTLFKDPYIMLSAGTSQDI